MANQRDLPGKRSISNHRSEKLRNVNTTDFIIWWCFAGYIVYCSLFVGVDHSRVVTSKT